MSSNHVNQLHLLQQNLHNILMQKQQFQQQKVEIESALGDLPTSTSSYKIVGKLMIAKPKEDLIKDLEEKKTIAELRLKTLETQEERLKEKLEQTQQEMLSELKKE